MRTRLIKVVKPTVILLTIGFIYIIIHNVTGFGLFCPINKFTGLYCPGCGSGRAAIALLRGHPLEAVGYNPLLFLLGLPCGALLLWEYLRFVFPGLGPKKIELPVSTARLALGMIAVFWLLRNIPGFEILAP